MRRRSGSRQERGRRTSSAARKPQTSLIVLARHQRTLGGGRQLGGVFDDYRLPVDQALSPVHQSHVGWRRGLVFRLLDGCPHPSRYPFIALANTQRTGVVLKGLEEAGSADIQTTPQALQKMGRLMAPMVACLELP